MKKVIIKNWQLHGDYMLYANIVSENRLSVILQSEFKQITCFGNEKHVALFAKELKKKKIDFETE